MYSTIAGVRVNLIYVAIVVALYDIAHILNEFRDRYIRFQEYENTEFGCLKDLFQWHCEAIYMELAVYLMDLIFTCFLIYGASEVWK